MVLKKGILLSLLLGFIIIGIISVGIINAGINGSKANNYIIDSFKKDINKTINPVLTNYWNVKYLSYEQGITTNITTLNESVIQLDIFNTNGGGYKFHSAICPLTTINDIELKIKDNAGVYTSIGNANYGKLTNYGMPSSWCSETNGTGFVLFASGSKDASYRLVFPFGQKKLILLTGSNSEKVEMSYLDYKVVNGVAFVEFEADPYPKPIKMITNEKNLQ